MKIGSELDALIATKVMGWKIGGYENMQWEGTEMKNSCTESLSTFCLPSVSKLSQIFEIIDDTYSKLVREGGVHPYFSSNLLNEQLKPKRSTFHSNINSLHSVLKVFKESQSITNLHKIFQKVCLLICLLSGVT